MNDNSCLFTCIPMRKIPACDKIVLGTASLGGVWGNIDINESIDVILSALDNGVSRVDTAPAYNRSEDILQVALKKWKGPRPFISTKVGRLKSKSANKAVLDFRTKTMRKSLLSSIDKLGEIDLLFLHEPEMVAPVNIPEVIDFLLQQKVDKRVKFIGLGGNVPHFFHSYIQAGVFDYVMSYNNLNACCVSGLENDIPLFKKNNLITYQGSTLHMGLLGNRFETYTNSPPDWIPENIIQNASIAKKLADSMSISLSALAHRLVLSLDEIDFVVLGARNMDQLHKSLNDYEQGPIDSNLVRKLIQSIK